MIIFQIFVLKGFIKHVHGDCEAWRTEAVFAPDPRSFPGKAISAKESRDVPGPDNNKANKASDHADNSRQKEAVAVALKYIQEHDTSPRVVAGGRGSIAEQILQIAFANGVKVREDADLAELLSAIDVESEIPLEAFAAVAEILAYVYRANNTLHLYTGTPGPDERPQTDPQTP